MRVIFYGPKDKLCETHCIHIQEDFMVVSPIHQLVQSSNVAVVTVCVCVCDICRERDIEFGYINVLLTWIHIVAHISHAYLFLLP